VWQCGRVTFCWSRQSAAVVAAIKHPDQPNPAQNSSAWNKRNGIKTDGISKNVCIKPKSQKKKQEKSVVLGKYKCQKMGLQNESDAHTGAKKYATDGE